MVVARLAEESGPAGEEEEGEEVGSAAWEVDVVREMVVEEVRLEEQSSRCTGTPSWTRLRIRSLRCLLDRSPTSRMSRHLYRWS